MSYDSKHCMNENDRIFTCQGHYSEESVEELAEEWAEDDFEGQAKVYLKSEVAFQVDLHELQQDALSQ